MDSIGNISASQTSQSLPWLIFFEWRHIGKIPINGLWPTFYFLRTLGLLVNMYQQMMQNMPGPYLVLMLYFLWIVSFLTVWTKPKQKIEFQYLCVWRPISLEHKVQLNFKRTFLPTVTHLLYAFLAMTLFLLSCWQTKIYFCFRHFFFLCKQCCEIIIIL